jgi:uncharacterized protein (TIGR02466 family)
LKWNTVGLFATPLVKIELSGIDDAKQYFYQTIYSEASRLANIEGDPDAYQLSHFHQERSIFKAHPQLAWLKKQIEEAATFAYQELLNFQQSGPLKITNAWFNLSQPGGAQSMHSHANSLLSGTLYLHTDDKTDITFFHPLLTPSVHPELYDKPSNRKNDFGLCYHHKEVVVGVSAGQCLFWPSSLKHGYLNNRTPNRLSLSFNLMPEYLNDIYQLHD